MERSTPGAITSSTATREAEVIFKYVHTVLYYACIIRPIRGVGQIRDNPVLLEFHLFPRHKRRKMALGEKRDRSKEPTMAMRVSSISMKSSTFLGTLGAVGWFDTPIL